MAAAEEAVATVVKAVVAAEIAKPVKVVAAVVRVARAQLPGHRMASHLGNCPGTSARDD
jgi:hypothetical protein